MFQEMDLNVEGYSIQLKMVHTPSVQWCERLIIFHLTAKNLMTCLGLSRILSQMMVLSGECSRSLEGAWSGLLTCTFASMFVTLYDLYPFPSSSTHLFFFQAPGYEELITALYLKGDSYLMSDPVFGVKSSLIVVGFFFKKLLSLFSFMLTLSSGTQINR